MKMITVNFEGFLPLKANLDKLKKNENFIMRILSKYYDVKLSKNPDYLFYSVFDDEYLNYDCVKIFYTGENIRPNFNFCDYAIGFDYLDFEDRYFRLPIFLIDELHGYEMGKELPELLKLHHYTEEYLEGKSQFCSFVYSNYCASNQRADFFHLLSQYKKVNSGGRYLNNIGSSVEDKLAFEKQHKFCIAFENSSSNGYTTEKLINSFVAGGIPIYWGNPLVGKMFNTKRFINCHDYHNFEEAVNQVRKIDNDDALYLKMINESIIIPEYDFRYVQKKFEEFLCHIIDQPLEKAKRRPQDATWHDRMENKEKYCAKKYKIYKKHLSIISKCYQPFKKVKMVDDFKKEWIIKNFKKKMP